MFDCKTEVTAGDIVNWTPHPDYGRYYPMLVTFVGDESIEGVVYSFNGHTTSAEHRGGCRHTSDPIWKDPIRVNAIIEDNDSGAFVLHPTMALILDIVRRLGVLEEGVPSSNDNPLAIKAPKRKGRNVEPQGVPPVDPNKSFREPGVGSPELTDEEKAARRDALEIALGAAN